MRISSTVGDTIEEAGKMTKLEISNYPISIRHSDLRTISKVIRCLIEKFWQGVDVKILISKKYFAANMLTKP